MSRADLALLLGVLSAAAAGFCSPCWYLGFLAIAAGLLWLSYDLTDVGA